MGGLQCKCIDLILLGPYSRINDVIVEHLFGLEVVRGDVVSCAYWCVSGVIDSTYQRAEREHIKSGRRVVRRLQLNFRCHIIQIRLRNTRFLHRPRHCWELQLCT